MTIGELIKQLKGCPKDMTISFFDFNTNTLHKIEDVVIISKDGEKIEYVNIANVKY